MENGDKKKPWWTRLGLFIRREVRWLLPGLGFKRWLLLAIAGAMLLGLGLAVVTIDVYRNAPATWWLPVLSVLSLRFLDRPIRFILFGGVGLIMILVGIWGANRSLLKPFSASGKPLVETLQSYRRKERGPRVVVIGGGHGLAALLRGLKEYTHSITAIVTVTDNGGSSGELRKNMGILPPGDIRNCLAALSNDEALLSQVFQYRFSSGAGLEGHSLGNLLISALSEITGSFEEAVAESGRVLAIYGQVLPATLSDVELLADVEQPGSDRTIHIMGESQITGSPGKVKRVWLNPASTPAFPPTIAALLNADLIIVGPGSLYTSLLPNLLVRDISEAINSSKALKFFVCNVATQRGETDDYNCMDHIRVIEKHIGKKLFDLLICNNAFDGVLPESVQWVRPNTELRVTHNVYEARLADAESPWRHDSKRLAKTILDLFEERTGPLVG
ncbi:MAG: uridine diphosphate-N-acetylglucosamine-binding protein YvcK [Anaerolineaceae bacterium]|nr:uridine diphosphate-N-acetylglucosamine-binding protein YvcK [Anaerolineaceae bacterium]